MNTSQHKSLVALARLDEPTLFRFIVLSLLLHVWIVLLFGSTTGGGARRDRGPGDIFDVTLRQRVDESGSSLRWTPGASDSTSGSALLPRERAAQRPAPPTTHDAKPAPTAPRATEGAAEHAQPALAPETPAPEAIDAAPRAAPAVVMPAPEPLQRFNPDAPETVDKPYVPIPVSPPAATPASAAAPVPAPPAAAIPVPRELPPAPPTAPQDIAPTVAPTARPAPETPPVIEREIAPAPLREAAPPPPGSEPPITDRSNLPAEPPPRADVAPAPRLPPMEPAPPLPTPRTPPPAIERETPPPTERPAARAPPIEPPPRSEPIAAPPAHDAVPAAAPTTPAIAEPVAPREQRIAPSSTPSAPAAPAAPAAPPAPSESAPATPVSPPRLRFGEPAPDEDMFKPRRDVAPAAEPGSAPKLDLDEAKRRAARDIVREGSGSRGLLSVVPPPPERESKEARALEKAAKPDCRSAYANMGLLAAVPLVASAMTNSGCRW